MRLLPLSTLEMADKDGANYVAFVGWSDCAALAAATGSVEIAPLAAGWTVRVVSMRRLEVFASATATSLVGSVGEEGTPESLCAAVALFGASAVEVQPGVDLTARADTAASIRLFLTSDVNLNTFTAGEVAVYLALQDPNSP